MAEIDWTKDVETTYGEPVEYHGLALESCRPEGDAKHIVMFAGTHSPSRESVIWFVTDLGTAQRADGSIVASSVRNVPPPERWVWAIVDRDGSGSRFVNNYTFSSKREALRAADTHVLREMQSDLQAKIMVAKLEPVESDDG